LYRAYNLSNTSASRLPRRGGAGDVFAEDALTAMAFGHMLGESNLLFNS
jgi:hypothetical protein